MRWPPPADWPYRDQSRQVLSSPHRWHVQEIGQGPVLVLIHGAGGSAHSFAPIIPFLAGSFRVIAFDLPGQGLTQLGARHRCGLDPMAEDIAHLIRAHGWEPVAIVGHSAGGALALRLSQRIMSVRKIIGINPALGHFQGLAGFFFPLMAKLLALTPGVARFFSRSAGNADRVRSLIEGTGSQLSPDGLAFYRRLVGDPAHVDATLLMMAQWSLDGLLADLDKLSTPTLFLTGDRDQAVPPEVAEAAAQKMPDAKVRRFAGLGHLAHEEAPDLLAPAILAFLDSPHPDPDSLHV